VLYKCNSRAQDGSTCHSGLEVAQMTLLHAAKIQYQRSVLGAMRPRIYLAMANSSAARVAVDVEH